MSSSQPSDSTLARRGLTLEIWQAMYAEQGGRCVTCNRSDVALQIDHEHLRGNVRGLLCSACNTGIAAAWDCAGFVAEANPWWDAERVARAREYLEKWGGPEETVTLRRRFERRARPLSVTMSIEIPSMPVDWRSIVEA